MKNLALSLIIAVLNVPALSQKADLIPCRVTVLDTTGRPIQDADVSAWEYKYQMGIAETVEQLVPPAKTDANGQTLIQFIPSEPITNNVFVFARKDGFAVGWNGVYRTAPIVEIRIILDRLNSTAGIVTDEKNRPLTGAKVTAYPVDEVMVDGAQSHLRWENSLFTTTTDSEGRFSYDSLAEWTMVSFTAEYPEHAFTNTSYNLNGEHLKYHKAGTKDIHIVMHPGGQITGTILAKRGIDVGGIRLTARGERIRTGKMYTAVCDRSGNFTFGDLPPDIYLVTAAAQPDDINQWLTIGAKVEIAEPGQTVENVKIRLREPIVLEVAVNDAETGQPVRNADVWFMQQRVSQIVPHLDYQTTTDGSGIARLVTLPGKCHIGASHDDYEMSSGDYLVRSTDTHFNLALAPHHLVTGQVLDGNGRPAEGVEVTTSTYPTEYKKTDRNGQFRIQYSLRSSKKQFCIARDFKNNLAGLVDITDTKEPVNVVLTPAAALTGRVVDRDNQPVKMARVRIIYHIPSCLLSSGNDLYTNENGGFEVAAIPYAQPDFSFHVSVSAPGYSKIDFEKIDVQKDMGQAIELPPLVLIPQNTTVSGVAVYEDGRPAAHKQIHVDSPFFKDCQPNLHSVTDENGQFHFDGACRDWLRIQCGSVMQNDFGFLYAKGGDTVTLVMDNNHDNLHTYIPIESLQGTALPMAETLTKGIDPDKIDGKNLLFCFWWIAEDQCKTTLLKLNQLAEKLESAGIVVILVNARPYSNRYASINIGLDTEWLAKNRIPFLSADIPDMVDIMEIRRAAGARVLPHLMLTDENRIITAEEFDIEWLQINVLDKGESDG